MNMSKTIDGFLDKKLESQNIEAIRGCNEKEFNFLYKINQTAYKTEEIFEKIHFDKDEVAYIISNFVITHKTFQSSVLLLERGLQDDALILFRSIFERIIFIKCAMDSKLFDKIKFNNITETIRILKRIKITNLLEHKLTIQDVDAALMRCLTKKQEIKKSLENNNIKIGNKI